MFNNFFAITMRLKLHLNIVNRKGLKVENKAQILSHNFALCDKDYFKNNL